LSNPVHDTWVFLGSFVKAFGIKGELKFHGSDDFWVDAFSSRKLIARRFENDEMTEVAVELDRVRQHGNNFVVKLQNVDDRNAAESMIGVELFIDRDDMDVELPDEELPFQVMGAQVRLEDGTSLGSVTSVMFSAAHNVYEVTSADGVVLIPAIPEFVVDRNDTEQTITVRPIPGLIDESS